MIGGVLPGGSAEAAGLRAGDRLLEVAGKPATLDVEPIFRLEEKSEGAKVPVVVLRDGAKVRVVMVVKRALAGAR